MSQSQDGRLHELPVTKGHAHDGAQLVEVAVEEHHAGEVVGAHGVGVLRHGLAVHSRHPGQQAADVLHGQRAQLHVVRRTLATEHTNVNYTCTQTLFYLIQDVYVCVCGVCVCVNVCE